MENNPINYADPTGHKKNFFQRVWAVVKKTAKKVASKINKYIVKPVANFVNSAKKWVSNKVQGVARAASNAWNGVTNFSRTSYDRVVSTFTGGGSTGAGRGIAGPPYPAGYWNANRAPNSQSSMSHEQLVAVQTAQRQ